MDIRQEMIDMGRRARRASRALAGASGKARSEALLVLADLLESESVAVAEANALDLAVAAERGLDKARVQRLTISEKVLGSMVVGCREVAAMADPVGGIESMTRRPNGMLVGRMRVPLGVVAMIYESRPNATVDAGILCLKAGNAVILRGGSEAFHSNACLAGLMHRALEAAGLPRDAVQVPATTDREAVAELLKLADYIDVVIPRGGEGLIRAVTEQATMPVLKHYKGVCHLFADASCDITRAVPIIDNAKTQYPSGCNALECLLVHRDVAEVLLPRVDKALSAKGVRFRACPRSLPLLGESAEPAAPADWGCEFLDLVLAVRVVDSLDEALDFIAEHGSNHTEAILSENYEHCMRFLREVDASLVVANATTRFNDGAQLGLGAEIGISTSKLHAYGPMGVHELTSAKFVLLGEGQVRE
ncbi:glutamate-5-semialdehyde dehydrogenase [Pseudodesulfovibrio sp. F-1]|uniref:Gamma-glutamyl phosphate reductase n=1 Tax=Pseudodesulfovibrio alkaliphilus TaxID=2661613 RepID=A0A7K1KK73_9BACT|nr:glutamate-5-semialdehyde dehydrogenase [Pseudodesulfovibrio alkaliphilus]MUM76282.1 glutamate-5-semialdehyde dehydrogenase [Pseudodesulfovibrio alkaliphilus]